MEKQGLFLSSLAGVLNAAGSALLNVYDVVSSIATGVVPGEKGNLTIRLKEYEKKIEKLYHDIGKEIVGNKDAAGTKAVVEDGARLIAEYRAEMEKIKQDIRKIEEEEKAAAIARKEAAQERAAARVKPVPQPPLKPVAETEEFIVTEIPEEAAIPVEAAPEMETAAVAVESTKPEVSVKAAEAGKKKALTAEKLETMLKSDLLKLCSKKKIKANEKMTKETIIKLILTG